WRGGREGVWGVRWGGGSGLLPPWLRGLLVPASPTATIVLASKAATAPSVFPVGRGFCLNQPDWAAAGRTSSNDPRLATARQRFSLRIIVTLKTCITALVLCIGVGTLADRQTISE